MAIDVETDSVEARLQQSHVILGSNLPGTSNISAVLLVPVDPILVLVDGLAQHSLPKSHGSSEELVLLTVLHVADVLPSTHADRQSPIAQLFESLVQNLSLGSSDQLLVESEVTLILHGLPGSHLNILVEI